MPLAKDPVRAAEMLETLRKNRNTGGRPRKASAKVTASLEQVDLEALDRKAGALGVTRQDAVRLAVRAWAGD